jgi:S1-C subfamily serine protease
MFRLRSQWVLPLLAAMAALLCMVLASAAPIPQTVRPKSNPSNANAGKKHAGAPADLSARQSMFGRDLVNKVKKGAVYIWSMTPDSGGALGPSSIGSGFIFQSLPEENAAYALTNHHVANDNTLMQVELWDHSTYKAEPVVDAPGIDVALIKILDVPPTAYQVSVLGDSDKVQIGDLALAIGAPGSWESENADRSDPYITFGLHQTATMRVVTGKETNAFDFATWRIYGSMDGLGNQMCTSLPWRFVVQCAINGGNSGGPLYNSRGEVIGLNHAHMDLGAQNQNFTIPINFAKDFAYQYLNTGKYEVPWFGMDVLFPKEFDDDSKLSEWEERHYDPKHLEVYGVRFDSPAERAGLKRGDIIVDFDGQVFPDVNALRLYIFQLPIGKQVPMTVKRAGKKMQVELEVAAKRNYDSEFSF